MTKPTYDATKTALLLIDPYNDFLSEGGKLWPMLKGIAEEVGLLENLRNINRAARGAGVQVIFVPHVKWEPGKYECLRHPNPSHHLIMELHPFTKGEWGSEWHRDFVPQDGDLIALEHWAQSGFANTDLDYLLKQREITHVICVGLLANTCVESTARYAMELGYNVTLVRDATAAFAREMMDASHDLNGPTYAHAILDTADLLQALANA